MSGYSNHREIMERRLKRPLKPDEVVHHKDSNPRNNKLWNLEVMTKEEHKILHTKGKNALYKFRKKKSDSNT